MKFDELTSFAHNVADSLASGVCFMVGILGVDVFREAAASSPGYITVDFVNGSTIGNEVSPRLRHAVALYSSRLAELAEKHRIDASVIKVMTARFGTDSIAGPHFMVTVEASDGRRSVDQYVGIPGRRFGKTRRSRI